MSVSVWRVRASSGLASRERLPWTSRTVVELEALVALVEETRRQGWCLVNQELEEGLVSMAAPVVDRAGRTIATINISGQANRTSPRQMQDAMLAPLRETARVISLRLPQG